jgi:hypothetical protein
MALCGLVRQTILGLAHGHEASGPFGLAQWPGPARLASLSGLA